MYDRYLSTTYAARNDLSPAGLERAALRYGRELAPHLPASRESGILEIGCGSGAFLRCCSDLGYSDLTGIDLSPEQVEFCHRQGFREVTAADALSFTRACTRTFAAVVMSDVLEHLPKADVLPTLEAIRGLLEPEGRLILRVPNLSNPGNVRTRYVDFTHEVGFTAESLAQVLRMARLRVALVDGVFQPHRNLLAHWLFDRLLWRIYVLVHRRVLHLKFDPLRGKNLLAVGIRDAAEEGEHG